MLGFGVNRKNAVSLNTELAAASKHCIDYVILHELIHLNITP
ncbi:M48 family metallopeptidase [Bacillus sp. J14TS2]